MSRISIGNREIGAVLAQRQAFFLRLAAGAFDRVHPGHRLWLAEPFYLEERFACRAPSVALADGARPRFFADHPEPPPGYGPRLPARFLCRPWHRHHLLITSRTAMRLHEISAPDLAAMGFACLEEFAAHWDRENAMFATRGFRWRDNPKVLRFGFKLLRRQVPEGAARPDLTGISQPLYRRAVAPPAPRPIAAEAPPSPPPAPAPPPAPPVAPPVAGRPSPPSTGPSRPMEDSFTTARGDKAFLAALVRERPGGHASAPTRSAALRQSAIPVAVSATGTCPRCGSRLAFGCEHYPAHHPEAAE